MTTILWWLAVNAATAAVMVPVVLAACRLFRRRPAVQHLLWAVVVLKLVTPPVVAWPWEVPSAAVEVERGVAETPPGPPLPRGGGKPVEDIELAPLAAAAPVPNDWRAGGVSPLSDIVVGSEAQGADAPRSPLFSIERMDSVRWSAPMIVVLWLLAGAAWLIVQVRRIANHAAVVRSASPASPDLVREVQAVADTLGVAAPQVFISRGTASPFVWCVGRPRLIWPAGMAAVPGVVAHELAHLRRGDHWVAWLELLAGAAWWWNPLYRYARRRLREAAEMACDALAIQAAPGDRRGYAELLLRLSSGFSPAAPAPVLGVGAGSPSSFERRLSMILSDRVSGTASVRGLLVAGALALAALPGWSPAQGPAAPAKEPATTVPAPASTAPIGPFSPPPRKPDPIAVESNKLRGMWRIVVIEVPGGKFKPKTLLRFDGNNQATIDPETPAQQIITFNVNPDKNPKWMDVWTAMDVPGENRRDQVLLRGIYELDGDKLRAVFQNTPDGKRPTEFKAEDAGTVMYTYERVRYAAPPKADSADSSADESPRIREKMPSAAPVAPPLKVVPPVPVPGSEKVYGFPISPVSVKSPTAGLDLSALDLGDRYLKAEASVKLTRRNFELLKTNGSTTNTQDLHRAEVEAELADRQLKLVKDFVNATVKQAAAAHDLADAQFQRGIKLADQGVVPLTELEQLRAKLLDAEGRLKQLKSVADSAGK